MRYFRNPELKRLTVIFTFMFIVVVALSSLLLNSEIERLNRNYIKQNTIMVGNIVKEHPELQGEIIDAIFSKDQSNYSLGNKVLSQYSYNEDLAIYKNPLMYKFYKSIFIKLIIFIAIFILLVYGISIFMSFQFYRKAERLSEASEKIMDGTFEKFTEENKEGEFYILASKFNLMSNRLKESMNNLKNEKIFLKNIISDISHQLKTPLSSLIMFNDIMKKDIPKEHRDNFLNLADEQLKRMEWLIINLLKIGRLEGGVVEFHVKENPLLITVNKALGALKEKAKEKGQNIIMDIKEDVYFKHDMEWTAEALSNIIKNSIEHTGREGEIIISCEETPISLTISIKDNGEGIPKNLQGKIFERFYKGENSTNPTSVGIGLSLSKSIIESQNGIIRVDSEEGIGTEFIITFLKTVI